MGVAAYGERESGHTGNFFNLLWSLPGVSRSGERATAAYFKEVSWYFDLARRWDGGMSHQLTPGAKRENYTNWDCTGVYLLGYALSKRALVLTGKKPSVVKPLSRAEVARIIDDGRDFNFRDIKHCYDGRKTGALLDGLSSWSPAVRKRSAQSLSRREASLIPGLIKQLDATDANARYGAIEALGYFGSKADAAGPRLQALLQDPDPWIRSLSAVALARLGEEVRQASVPHMMRSLHYQDSRDPRQRVHRSLAESLFQKGPGRREPISLLKGDVTGVDREQLYPALRVVLQNQDGCIRGRLSRVYRSFSEEDVKALLPDILKATREPAPSGTMFADEIRVAGLELLAKYRVREGLEMTVDFIEPERWGQRRRVPASVKILDSYGTHAKAYLPQLREIREAIIKQNRHQKDQHPHAIALQKSIDRIGASTRTPELISLKDFAK